MTTKPCTHPPTRLFTWFAYDSTLCVACCDCGEVLAGAAQPWRQVTEAEEQTHQRRRTRLRSRHLDGYILGSACIEGFGPLAYANNPHASATTRSLSVAKTTSTSSPTASPKPSSCCKN